MASVCKQKNGKLRVMWYDERGKRRSKTFEDKELADEFKLSLEKSLARTDHIFRMEPGASWRDPRCIIKP